MTDREVPGPPGSLLLGSARALQRDQLATYEHAMHAYGDLVRFRVGPPRLGFSFLTTFHPDGARQILGGGSDGHVKDAPVFTEFRRLLGGGVAMLEGAPWRERRRLLQPLFTRQRVAADIPAIVRTADRLVADLQPAVDDGREIDLYEIGMRYGLDVLAAVLFGPDATKGAATLRSTVPVVNDYLARRGLAPVRVPASWPTPSNRRARSAVARLHELVDHMAARQRAGDGAGELLARLLDARDPDSGAALDDDGVRDEVLIFLLAGYESTSSALAFTLDRLGQDASVQERVREEAQRVVGDRAPSAGDLPHLDLTTRVVQEVLRFYPPVHTMVRKATQGGEVLGHPLRPGSIVAVSVWGIHRNPAVWDDPSRFDPDRFLPEASEGRDRYAYLPFGGGPRTCIGVHLAMADLVLAVAGIVRRYTLRTPQGPRALRSGVTLGPADPLWCRLSPAGG